VLLKLFSVLFFISLGGAVVGLTFRGRAKRQLVTGLSLCGAALLGFLWAYWYFFLS
jgi:hypothetical protein